MITDIKQIIPVEPVEVTSKAEQLMQLEVLKKQLTEKIDEYREQLLAETKRLDVLSLKTGSYTISRVKKVTPKVTDFSALKKALEAANIPYDTQEVFADHMKLTFKQLAEDNRHMDGLDVHESEYIMIRINKE